MNEKEIQEGRQRIVDMDLELGQVSLRNPKLDTREPPKAFTFDQVYDWDSKQIDIFNISAKPIVDSVISGYNGTMFAYGQTGTGKSFTMDGGPGELQGIIPNAFKHIFSHIDASDNTQFLVRASYLEIYNEEIRDLLSRNPKNKLDLKENVDTGVYVKGLNSFVVKSVPEIQNVMDVGKKNRSVGATLMNQDSSRSHSIFCITIETSEITGGADAHIRAGKLNLVDLAGSERQSKTGATGDRLKEATKINLSLSALGNVISSLVDGKSGHIPYRDSKLTRLLQDSLGGNTKTVMIANLGPADYNYDETLSTLRYANRAKNIKNKPRINEDPKDAMLREFQEEIRRLKAELEQAGSEGGLPTDEERIVEKVVEKEKPIDEREMESMKREIEAELKANISAENLDEEELARIREEAEKQAKEELQKLEAEKEKARREAAKLMTEAQTKEEERAAAAEQARKAAEQKEALQKKLEAMQSKIRMGEQKGVGLKGVVDETAEEVEKKRRELEERQARARSDQERLAKLEEEQLASEETYSTMQQEADQKGAKLKKLWAKYRQVKQEVDDINQEIQREREDMMDSLRMLTQQMALKTLVIEAFVPAEEVAKVQRRAKWDEEREQWDLEPISAEGRREQASGRRPVSASNVRRPMSGFAKMAQSVGDQNPRFKSENILSLELDMPERTTLDFGAPMMDDRIQAALDAAFVNDGEMLFMPSDASGNVILADENNIKKHAAHRPQSARPKSSSRRRGTEK
eukprot:CAMPEP_0177590532 /NCGR_PEP_ID=MMETSP0419_2-20121207/7465_1 /TAXON_ID=582737 /ORGANISM="Tetraselmis sp., Strain GSL018" /LENGTH=750 /DNA_ID=CAMNT_0019081115 /DNA_START=182 /DNA_END=2434 /DNA_ORIENTATION=-